MNNGENEAFVALLLALIVILSLLTVGYLLAEIFFTPRI